MYNCIFTAHCTESNCDRSCPTLVETSYLLERNDIPWSSFVFSIDGELVNKANAILDKCSKQIGAHVVSGKYSTMQWADILTYCAICRNWQGSKLHCTVYNLKFSKYIELTKRS